MDDTLDTTSGRQARRRDAERATCGGCRQVWTGAGRAHCGTCHRLFASVTLFDQHRRAYTCIDPATIPNMEFRGCMWHGPAMPEAVKLARRGGQP